MDNYIINCSEEQTKKALELGAPIHEAMSKYNSRLVYEWVTSGKETRDSYNDRGIAIIGKSTYKIPTAEKMIGWLEEQDNINYITISNDGDNWYYDINTTDDTLCLVNLYCSSRKDATLKAISEALDYLRNQKSSKI